MLEFTPKVSNHVGKRRIMIKPPNGENFGAQYLEDRDGCVRKFQTKEQAERLLQKYLEYKKGTLQ